MSVEMHFKKIIIVGVALILSGCSNLQWPPPGQLDGKGRLAPRTSLANSFRLDRVDIPASGVIEVQNRDTLFILSRRYRISVRAIIEENNLTPPYRLEPGESLIIPRPRNHEILAGESLYRISRRYGVDTYELARLNYLQPPYSIYVGQKLLLPSSEESDIPKEPVVAKSQPVEKKPLPSVKQNAEPISDKPVPSRKPTTRKSKPDLKKRQKALKALKTIPVPRVKTSSRFNWPVRGKLLSIYGSKGEGLHNDGINIVAPRGTSVWAAGTGVVVYAGNELRGFGYLLLIKHSGGWVTAYAHNDALLVKRGDKVNQGQVIAKVGASGNVIRPQLHFEIRKGKRAINPLRHLKRLSVNVLTPPKIL